MSLNSSGNITVIAEEAARTLARLTAAQSGPGLPSPESVVVVGPPDERAIPNFNAGVALYSRTMKSRLADLRSDLLRLRDNIEATLEQFVEKDAEVSDEAAKLSGAMDSLPTTSSSSVTPTASPGYIGNR
jgi:hypothetical protein